jgi:hypothetical protein
MKYTNLHRIIIIEQIILADLLKPTERSRKSFGREIPLPFHFGAVENGGRHYSDAPAAISPNGEVKWIIAGPI